VSFLAENYVKLQYFVTILSLVILQGSVCVHTPVKVYYFNTHVRHWLW